MSSSLTHRMTAAMRHVSGIHSDFLPKDIIKTICVCVFQTNLKLVALLLALVLKETP